MDPDDDAEGLDDYQNEMAAFYEELADYNDSAARSDEDGWFYADED